MGMCLRATHTYGAHAYGHAHTYRLAHTWAHTHGSSKSVRNIFALAFWAPPPSHQVRLPCPLSALSRSTGHGLAGCLSAPQAPRGCPPSISAAHLLLERDEWSRPPASCQLLGSQRCASRRRGSGLSASHIPSLSARDGPSGRTTSDQPCPRH